MPPDSPTVFLVDDDASIRRSLARLVRQAGWEVLVYASAEEFLASLSGPLRHPACAVVDLQMPGLNGLALQAKLARVSPDCPVILMSGRGDIPSTVQAMRQGAVTFLTKPFDPDELLAAVTEALGNHRAVLEAEAKLKALSDRLAELTDREREVMTWVITGALNKQIAAALTIVEKTVKVHRARAMEKMRVSSVAELVRLCALIGVAPATPPVAPV